MKVKGINNILRLTFSRLQIIESLIIILLLPGIADHDGHAGGEEHEDEEELLG